VAAAVWVVLAGVSPLAVGFSLIGLSGGFLGRFFAASTVLCSGEDCISALAWVARHGCDHGACWWGIVLRGLALIDPFGLRGP